jgi:hypothetical protein
MLSKPASCEGCPLQHIGTGFMKPIAPTNGVVLLGEALGEKEEEVASHSKDALGIV